MRYAIAVAVFLCLPMSAKSASCKYRDDLYGFIETLTCEFGCCEHGCCTNSSKLSPTELGLCIGVPLAFILLLFILAKVIIYYCRKRLIKRQAALLQQLIEAGRPRPTIILHLEPELGQSRPQGGEHELPVA